MNAEAVMKKHQSGVALVEFALILPVLLVLTFTVIELGRAVYQYNTITKSVRDGVRYLSMQTPGTGMAEARNLIVYGKPSATGGTPLVTGLSTSQVPDPVWKTVGEQPLINTVTVEVRGYTFNSPFGSVFGIVFGPITFPPISATMRAQL